MNTDCMSLVPRFCLFAFLILFASSSYGQPALTKTPEWKKASSTDYDLNRQYTQTQLIRLFDGKYAELEAEAESLQKSPQLTRSGDPRSAVFFKCFDYSYWNDQPQWERFLKALEGWKAAYPSSINPKIASATAYIDYAWWARGSGYADSVSNAGWALMKERLQIAEELLKEALPAASKNPVYWSNSIRIAIGANKSNYETLEMAQTALEEVHGSTAIYSSTCIYLLPRWHGKPGEWEAWLNKNLPPGDEAADMLYARVVYAVEEYINVHPTQTFASGEVSWSRTQKGLRLLCANFPESTSLKSMFLFLSYQADDRASAREAAALMNHTYDPTVIYPSVLPKVIKWLDSDETKSVSGPI